MTTKELFCNPCLKWSDHIWDIESVRVTLRPMDDEDRWGWRCDECGTIVLVDGSVVYS
jgi:hypothetical protein